ncbi:type II toxin-antitoxin system HicA family toxin [Lepagella muris]|jgi:predicted RNA binding protein YcfA (HicA-like mRNA interferase family)|uniref:Type II toxin-antitoxin system HicA family toxin n=1 Tax=Lepagella muris TaxID=3032870 RepID=A0AC61RI14_9BACT|nr:type II toxin-antitoxin system HicA family toxin [Lepagella muris]ROT05642.1 type II toxin-antitoxin system HicA family toxin [Muribaculaceae bacterium Isolate-037 (Harlan)]TGY77531.1 type II toxin-antitoxin system HicA family toxin [Lepagella muris]THG50023.1 type II toxin-antitoxin system HicA family toxin [Bacteroidales bacterium]TKC63173.1 type II toxin-antitoxin system HicA family toxin [Bacteroidales bacterium]
MGTKDKLIERFKRLPKDFTYEEVVRLLKIFGYTEYNKGATSGSRVRFVRGQGIFLDFHKPHPGSIMKMGTMRSIMSHLKEHDNL